VNIKQNFRLLPQYKQTYFKLRALICPLLKPSQICSTISHSRFVSW